MGCSQSKTSTDQVVERVSVDTPSTEAPVPESIKTTDSEPETVVEVPSASADELPAAPVLVPVEEDPESAEPAAEVEEAPKTEESAAPVEEPAQEATLPVEEAPVEEATELVDEVAEEPAPVEEAPKTEEKALEADIPVEAAVEAEAPKSEPVVKEEAPKSTEAPVEVPEEPKAEVAAAPASEAKPATEGALTFKAEEVTFNNKGVAFYNFDGSDSRNPANDVHLSKRYSEFKALHAQLTQQLAFNQDDEDFKLPTLPKTSLLQGRRNKKMLQDRKTQFTALLNAIAAYPVASQSDVFNAFLA